MILNNLGVSRSTVLEDIKNLRENLTKYNIDLTYDRTNGYKIKGDEIMIRSHFLSTMYKYE